MIESGNFREADCLVLDIDVPGSDGFEVLEYIHNHHVDKPVIFISAHKETPHLQKAFDLGACDYLKKPFELDELEVRIRHRLKATPKKAQVVDLGGHCHYDINHRELMCQNGVIQLSSIQKRLFHQLALNQNRLLTLEYLVDTVWEGKPVSASTISSHIKALRMLLPCCRIQNIRGEGYVLQAAPH